MGKIEQTDLFEILRSIQDAYLLSQDEKYKICNEMEIEVAESERRIRSSYREKIDKAESNCSSLKKIWKTIKNY